ncbi:MAG: transposase family protein, partial [Sweet potato little leaf phytoplasma]|nr:transposase family protein [Sweet potato little leaf phytoplasma]
ACAMAKSHSLPYSPSTTTYTAPLQLIVSDLWGPTYIPSANGYRYYISFVDVFSRYTWIYFLKSKSDAFAAFVKFKTHIEKLLNLPILQFQSDNGGEFLAFKPYLDSHGISHRFSCPHTSQQNGIAECKHRHIVDTGLALLSHSSMPLKFWDEAFSTAVFFINRLPSEVLHGKSPLDIIFCTHPDYSFLKTFGCQCFPNRRHDETDRRHDKNDQKHDE